MEGQATNADEIQRVKSYSIIVGLSILVFCVSPCVLFSLLAKCFQKQSPKRRQSSTIRTLVANMKFHEKEVSNPLDSTGFGTFGPMQISPDQIDCIEKIVNLKSRLPCITLWKAYAPAIMMDNDEDLSARRLVAVKKLSVVSVSDIHGKDTPTHSNCIRTELVNLSQIPPHHHLKNLLGVCLHNSNPVALIMEYPPFGCLHTYLLIKRRARISNNASFWGGLRHIPDESLVIKALIESERPHLSMLLDDYETRSKAFNIPLCESFSELDVLLFSLQIASVMEFLCDQGFLHKRLSTENIVISPGFYLKVMGMDFEPPMIHRSNSGSKLRRTASGRNLVKWDAPEVIEKMEYTEKSEIWRFAMTLWEICSLGDTPFIDVPARTLGDLVKKGEVPHKPEGTSERLYNLMSSCWNIETGQRPTFRDILDQLHSMLRTHEFATGTSVPDGRLSPLESPVSCSISPDFVSPTDSHPCLSEQDDSTAGGLHRRLSRRPFVLPLSPRRSPATLVDPSTKNSYTKVESEVSTPLYDKNQSYTIGSVGSGETPLLGSISPVDGYLETDV